MASGFILSEGNPYLHHPSGIEWVTSYINNAERDRMNPGIRNFLCQVPTTFSEGGWGCRDQDNFLSLGWETILKGVWTTSFPMTWRCGKKMGIIIFITLLFSLKGLEILHQERRGQVNTIVIWQLNSILFHKSGSASKQHSYQSINL